jgi:hypothetical protein
MTRPGRQVGATPRTPSGLPCCAQTGHTGWMEHPSAHPLVGSQARRCGRSAVPRFVCPAPDTQRRTRPSRMEEDAAMIGTIQPIHRRKADSKAAIAVAPNQLAMGQGIESSSRKILSAFSIGPHLLSDVARDICKQQTDVVTARVRLCAAKESSRDFLERLSARGRTLSGQSCHLDEIVAAFAAPFANKNTK